MGTSTGGHTNRKNASRTIGTFSDTSVYTESYQGIVEKGNSTPPDENFTGKPCEM